MTCIVRQDLLVTEPDTIYEPAGTLYAAGRQPEYIRGRPGGGLGQVTSNREPGIADSLPGHRNPSNSTSTGLGFYLHRKGPNQYKPSCPLSCVNPFKLPSCDGSTTKSFHKDICRDNSTTPREGESIAQACGRLKSMLYSCPNHELSRVSFRIFMLGFLVMINPCSILLVLVLL